MKSGLHRLSKALLDFYGYCFEKRVEFYFYGAIQMY